MFTKSLIVAVLALFICLSSTAQAAFEPGNPFNCTAFQKNCRSVADTTYGGGKNTSYSGVSARCNVTNISNGMCTTPEQEDNFQCETTEVNIDTKPLCGLNVVCTATFLIQAAAPNTTVNSSSPNGIYTVGAEDLTTQLLSQYDTSKCPKSAANAKTATTIVAMLAIASLVTFMSSML
ncbi:hypothetical protein FBU30_000520 [Linnemannia zychae]|nr:hypothetical protein FBU30_000520 [Linnemannia zychae]